MDKFYNQSSARARLELIIAERRARHTQLRLFQEADGASTTAMPVYVERHNCWKLTQQIDDAGTREEIVLRVQGIICQKDLPPITKPQKIENRQRRYLRQSVTLTSLGSCSMKDSIVNIQAIHHLFFRMLPDNRMEDWSPATFENYEAIDIGNRYFTDRRDILTSEAISFKTSVDPDGILEAVTSGDEFAHTHENEVEYHVIEPLKFRTGDIVEAQVSFVAVPLKEKKFKLIIVMRALTLLDCTPLKDAEKAKYYERLQEIPKPFVLKRKVGYSEDDDEETRAKISRMAIDNS